MSKKIIGLVAILIVIISVGSVYALTSLQAPVDSSSNSLIQPTTNPNPTAPPTSEKTSEPTSQPTELATIETYTGLLVSSNYKTSETNGVESTQLIFTNKTFNYPGYLALENDAPYNVTFYSGSPNQALTIAKIDMTIGLMGNAEQVSVSNAVFANSTAVTLTIRNTGSATITVNSATVDGNVVTLSPATLNVAKGVTGQITLTLPSGISFAPGAQYEVRLATAKGTTVVYSATYNPIT